MQLIVKAAIELQSSHVFEKRSKEIQRLQGLLFAKLAKIHVQVGLFKLNLLL